MMCGTPWAVRCTSTCCDRICDDLVTGVTAEGRREREHAWIAARASSAPVTEPTARMREFGRTMHEPAHPWFHPPDMHRASTWHGTERNGIDLSRLPERGVPGGRRASTDGE